MSVPFLLPQTYYVCRDEKAKNLLAPSMGVTRGRLTRREDILFDAGKTNFSNWVNNCQMPSIGNLCSALFNKSLMNGC